MAQKITKLRPYQGFCAETSEALCLQAWQLLVSRKYNACNILINNGRGATDKLSAVRWV